MSQNEGEVVACASACQRVHGRLPTAKRDPIVRGKHLEHPLLRHMRAALHNWVGAYAHEYSNDQTETMQIDLGAHALRIAND